MEDATGWSNWYSANCDEDCAEQASQQQEEEEQEQEEEGDEDEEEADEDERRLRATRKRKLSTSGSSQPGIYNNVASFCMNCMNDCDEDGDVQKSLEIWQDFSGAECTETEIPSSTYNSDGELINYFIGPFCNGNTDEIKLGVFLDQYCTTVIDVDAGYVIAQIEEYQDSQDEDATATATSTASAVVTAFDVDLAWAIIETEIACDENKNDENDAPSYLATSDEQTTATSENEVEYEFSEVCSTMLQYSFGCTGEILGYYNENTISACSFAKLLKGCTSNNFMSECTTTMIDLQGDTYAISEGLTMDIWAMQAAGQTASGSNKLQKTVLSLMIPATAILGILACYYAGKISGDGKGSVELSRQGGAMA